MKTFGTVLLVAVVLTVSFNLNAQCDSLLRSETDRFTKETKFATEIFDWVSEGQTLSIVAAVKPQGTMPTSVVVVLGPHATGCIDEHAETIFLLDDSSTVKIKGDNEYNCDPHVRFSFYKSKLKYNVGPTLDDLQKLGSHKTTAIRIRMYSQYFDYDLTKEQSTQLQQIFSCAMAKYQSL